MKRLVRNLTTSAETKTRQNMRLSQDHYREQNRDPRALLAFLPVFPTPLPPITAILMARPGLGYSAAGHSAIVVMFWMRRMFPLVSSVQTQEEEKNPKCWRAASGRKGEFNPVALPLLFREDSQLKAGGGCCCCCGARAAFIALERRSNLIGRGWSPPHTQPPSTHLFVFLRRHVERNAPATGGTSSSVSGQNTLLLWKRNRKKAAVIIIIIIIL